MKFKYYLRGCGLGIILTVIVLTVALHNRGGVMTDEKVIVRAWELGMVMPDDTEGFTAPQSTEDKQSTEDTQSTESVESTE